MIRSVVKVDTQGKSLEFWCSGCKELHTVQLSRHAWNRSLTRPTIAPIVRMRVERGACECQITAGVAHYSLDSFHGFAGQLVPLEDVP